MSEASDCEYVVVGSGAGGGTVAARLAEAGHRVMLLEAGGDPRQMCGGDPLRPDENRLPNDYDVPAFHPFASENEATNWHFFVRHYGDDTQKLDANYREFWGGQRVDGVFYPRASALGGCTAHNAMIFVYPHNADWDNIASLTGDDTWRSDRMRRYFERIEDCHYRRIFRWLSRLGINPTRHGWSGWLRSELAAPMSALEDGQFIQFLVDSAVEMLAADRNPLQSIRWALDSQLDPNDWRFLRDDRRLVRDKLEGIRLIPLATHNHARRGTRERVLEIASKYPDRLKIQLNSLATRVLLNAENHALGVEYMSGERLYRAHAKSPGEQGQVRKVLASREVILAGGAFNTPQLLMLSGIGPPDELRKHGIEVKIELPGVGKNLQDRYEIGVVHRIRDAWAMLRNAQFAEGDPQFREWQKARRGVYATNGVAIGIVKRSRRDLPLPDLFLLGLLGPFSGYFPGYSTRVAENPDRFTWTILKAHTKNRAGMITLRSCDPRDPPMINFNYFAEGGHEDLESLLSGIALVRKLTESAKRQGLITEELPGENLTEEELERFVRYNSWGHHASSTCAIGPRDRAGVLDSNFRVHGTEGLRVVDASVFPRIPGFFLVSAVYMVGEKAADAILSAR